MKRGFTLIELLVVIAVIALIAAILFPVLAQARDKARQATCLSNVKQLSLGVMMYAQDHDETLLFRPSGQHCSWRYICEPTRLFLDWWDIVLPYTKNNQIYYCPSAQPSNDVRLTSYGITNVAIGYTMGIVWPGADGRNSLIQTQVVGNLTPGITLAEVTRPADTILLGEAGRVWNPVIQRFNSRDNPSPVISWSARIESGFEWGPENRHGGGANMGFVDGHARWMRPEQFYGALDVPNRRLTVDCNGIWFRPNRDERKVGDPAPPACGQ